MTMLRKYTITIMAASLMLFFSAQGFAAEPRPGGRPGGQDRPQEMRKVRERIETLRMWKLTKALDLDANTSAKLFPIINKYDKKRADLEASMREDMKDLREAIRDNVSDAKLKPLLDRLEENHRQFQGIGNEERTELKRILTLQQQAKYVLFQVEFMRELRETIREVRDRRQDGQNEQGRPGMQDREGRGGRDGARRPMGPGMQNQDGGPMRPDMPPPDGQGGERPY